MKQWLCIHCWHEVLSDHRKPEPIHWSDGHICEFKSPEDISTVDVISFDQLLAGLNGVDVPEEMEGNYACQLTGKSVFFFDIQNRHFVSGKVAMMMSMRRYLILLRRKLVSTCKAS